METKKVKLTISMANHDDIKALSEFIQELSDTISSVNEAEYDQDVADKIIAKSARRLPQRAYLVPINCHILMDNFQDNVSDVLEMPKWISNMEDILTEIYNLKMLPENLQTKVEVCLGKSI